jgi:ribosomal-protein-serine acetyltransferase
VIGPLDIAPGVVMRRYERADAPSLLAAVDADRDRLGRWMPWVPFSTTVADFEDFIERSAELELDGRSMHLGLFADDAMIGSVGASIGSLNFDEADVGYWVASGREGTGLISTSVSWLIDWLFDERDMHRITIRAALANARSRAVAERLGFTFEGVLRESLLLEGIHQDAALYSLVRREWRSNS